MTNRKFILPVFILLIFAGRSAFAADNTVDPREAAIDRAIGGMIEGSRPLLPQNYAGKNQDHKAPGSNLSPSMDARATASASTQNSSGLNSVTSPGGNVAGNESGNAGAGTNDAGANLGGTIHETATGGNLEGNVSGGTSGGTLEAGANVGTETGGTTTPETEPTSGGSTDSSIVNVDANVDLSGESPAVDANLTVDTNADTLLNADTSATTDATSADATVAESGTVAGEDLTTIVNEALVDATLDSEVVATDTPVDSEATAGLEADVDPVTADSDVASSDSADGLSTTPSL